MLATEKKPDKIELLTKNGQKYRSSNLVGTPVLLSTYTEYVRTHLRTQTVNEMRTCVSTSIRTHARELSIILL